MASRKKSGPSEGARVARSERGSAASLRFSRVNLILGGAGLLALVAGYALLANGSITAAPILLVLGYVVLVPLALIL